MIWEMSQSGEAVQVPAGDTATPPCFTERESQLPLGTEVYTVVFFFFFSPMG